MIWNKIWSLNLWTQWGPGIYSLIHRSFKSHLHFLMRFVRRWWRSKARTFPLLKIGRNTFLLLATKSLKGVKGSAPKTFYCKYLENGTLFLKGCWTKCEEKMNGKLLFFSQLITAQNVNKLGIQPCILNFFHFQDNSSSFFYSIKNKCTQINYRWRLADNVSLIFDGTKDIHVLY